MDLFLETPQQQAERMLRQQQRLMEMQMQGAAVQALAQNDRPALIIVLGGSGHCGARRQRAISASQRYPDAESRGDDPLTC